MLASGRCLLSHSVAVCLISFVFLIRVSGVSPRGFCSQAFFLRLSLCWHFVCHAGVTMHLSLPLLSLFELLYLPFLSLSLSFHPLYSSDFLVERDNDYCVCETPCNLTRYGKEMSFVKIPSKASAKYLAKKFNKTEQYIA